MDFLVDLCVYVCVRRCHYHIGERAESVFLIQQRNGPACMWGKQKKKQTIAHDRIPFLRKHYYYLGTGQPMRPWGFMTAVGRQSQSHSLLNKLAT